MVVFPEGKLNDGAQTFNFERGWLRMVTNSGVPIVPIAIKNSYKIISYNGKAIQCQAGLLINAAGPWANHVLAHITPKVHKLEIELVQGTHIIVDGKTSHGIYYVEAPQDQRAIFVMPWQDHVMVGTTETIFTGDPSQTHPLPAEKHYLFETLCHYFPAYRTQNETDIISSFAGLRVLPKIAGSAFSRPRETIFQPDNPVDPRLVTIYGGKLTAYRATSEKLIDRFKAVLPDKTARADTRTLALTPD